MSRARLGLLAASLALFTTAKTSLAGDHADACADMAEQGQRLRRAGSFNEARKKLAACARDECPAVIRKDCDRWLADVTRVQPSVIFRAESASGDELGHVRVLVDGGDLGATLDNGSIELDPGSHHVQAFGPRGATFEEDLVLTSGEKDRVVVLRFADGPSSGATSSGPRAHDATRPAEPPGVPVIAWGLGIGGAASFIAGAALWIVGSNEHGQLAKSCAPSHSCTTDQVGSARTKLVVGDVLASLGLAAVAGGVVIGVYLKPSPDPANKPSARGFSVGLRGSF